MPHKNTPLPLSTRFWMKVDTAGDCWLWTASLATNGYGLFWADKRHVRAHRYVWEITNGPIPDGMCVCHRCDNPRCVNPAHLWLGSHDDNMADKRRKGRTATGDRSGARRFPERFTGTRGEQNGKSKLTEESVTTIRRLYDNGDATITELARRFGVSAGTVGFVVRRQTWKHLG